jgi:hypothetical protein
MNYPLPYHPSWDILDPSKFKDDWLRCRRKHFWRNILGWRSDRPSNHLVFGEGWHRAMAHLRLNGYDPQNVDAAYQLFLDYYRQEFPAETDELFSPKTPDNAFKALCFYAGKYQDDLDEMEILHSEVSVSIPISPTRIIHGRMDSIYRRRSEDLIAADDHKTHQGYIDDRWNNQWTGDFQMNTYTHALYCLFPIEKVKGLRVDVVAFPKTKSYNPDLNRDFQRIPCYRSPQYMQNWLWTVNSYYDEIDFEMQRLAECKESDPILMAFPQNPTACSDFFGCPYLDFCFTWRNPIQVQDRMPSGFKVEFWNPLDRVYREKIELKWPKGR